MQTISIVRAGGQRGIHYILEIDGKEFERFDDEVTMLFDLYDLIKEHGPVVVIYSGFQVPQ